MPPLAVVVETLTGVCYLIAYILRLSCWRDYISSTGLTPTREVLSFAKTRTPKPRLPVWLYSPSILWVCNSDAALQSLLIVGAICSASAVLRIYPQLCILICTVIYTSLLAIHSPSFPVGGHRILATMGTIIGLVWLGGSSGDHMLALMRSFYVLMMFFSGLTKVITDVGWRRLYHLDYHYWTQPLPTRLGYWFNSLPHWFHALSTLASLVIELTCPLFAAWNAYTRLLTCAGCFVLVLLINTTGNFGFFGAPLYVATLSILDDRSLQVLAAGWPTFASLYTPDFTWATELTRPELIALIAYTLASIYVTVRSFPSRLASFVESTAWYDAVVLMVLGSYYFSPYFFYWTSPKRRHEAVFEIRGADGKWQELILKHSVSATNKLAPCTFGFWEWPVAFMWIRLVESNEWKDGTPIYVRIFMQALLSGNTRFNHLLQKPPPRQPTEIRVKIYDYKFVGQDLHKLWVFHIRMGGHPPPQWPEPRFLKGDKPGDYWKRELMIERPLELEEKQS